MNILLAGQPNVGKTSIFNKLVLNKKNIVHKRVAQQEIGITTKLIM